jgi:hypothetical protein
VEPGDDVTYSSCCHTTHNIAFDSSDSITLSKVEYSVESEGPYYQVSGIGTWYRQVARAVGTVFAMS